MSGIDWARVDTALGARLRKAEVLPRKTLEDGLIHVEVTPLPKGGYHYDVYAERGDKTLGRAATFHKVLLPPGAGEPGSFVTATITGSTGHSLLA